MFINQNTQQWLAAFKCGRSFFMPILLEKNVIINTMITHLKKEKNNG